MLITAQIWVPIEKNSTSAYVAKSFCAELNIVFNVNLRNKYGAMVNYLGDINSKIFLFAKFFFCS